MGPRCAEAYNQIMCVMINDPCAAGMCFIWTDVRQREEGPSYGLQPILWRRKCLSFSSGGGKYT